MKKVVLLSSLAIAMFFASCVKDRTCSCETVTTSGGSNVTTTDDVIIKDKTLRKANSDCKEKESSGDVLGVKWDTNCRIK